MLATVHTATIVGVEAVPVEVQVDVSNGLPSFGIVGLGDAAVLEARERVRSAVRSSGFEFPNSRVVVNLAPAPLRKHGTGFDLPIAAGVLAATRQIPADLLRRASVVGELALDGGVRPVAGMLAHALAAKRQGRVLLGPAGESCMDPGVDELDYLGVDRLAALARPLENGIGRRERHRYVPPTPPDLADVVGQHLAKHALEVAAAGGHNLLFNGPPGSGKTMLARRLVGILPPLSDEERLETALVHSVAGLDERSALAGVRPFRAPHHTCSVAGLVGGGSPPRPGEASLAHNGVLFLDEFPEFGPAALQTLRQPLEDGTLTLVRAQARVAYPARFALVAAMNPCPCGYHGDSSKPCRCSPQSVQRYASRIGGPLMDRMDIYVRMNRVDTDEMLAGGAGEPSSRVRERVLEARARAEHRGVSHAQLRGAALLDACRMDAEAAASVSEKAGCFKLSGRAVTRLLRVARTIADLQGADRVSIAHIEGAVGYRAWDGA